MTIQIISSTTNYSFKDVKWSTFSCPRSLDEYDINIIDLDSSIWYNELNSVQSIDDINNFSSIKTMIEKSHNSKIIFILPRNQSFIYNHAMSRIQLKDMLEMLTQNIIKQILPFCLNKISLIYEITTTKIQNESYAADFFIDSPYNGVLKSEKSEKITTIKNTDRFYITTLNILKTQEALLTFLSFLFPKNISYPKWLIDSKYFDDVQQENIIEQSMQRINDLQAIISNSKMKLEENLKYKSILSTNGDALVTVVFEILEKILNCSLSDFIDEKKQDFLIKKDNVTFIGEIKGITSNVKSENVSQLEVHNQMYLDMLQENNTFENIKQLLIINPFRTKPILEREPVHDIQINLAKKYGCLIVTTETLLKIFELFQEDKLTSDKITTVFATKTGLLSIDSF